MKATITVVLLLILSVLAWRVFDHDSTSMEDKVSQAQEQLSMPVSSQPNNAQQRATVSEDAEVPQPSLYAQALTLLAQAKNGDAQAQFELSKILHLCGIFVLEDNAASFTDDANYYLATVNETDSKLFKSLKQTLSGCSEFTSQNINDFMQDQHVSNGADYWLIQAVMQRHPAALQQALFYFPPFVHEDKDSLELLDQQLANDEPEALFNLGTCLVQRQHKQGAALMMQGCKRGKDCSATAIDPMRLIVLFGCTAFSREEQIGADGTTSNPQLACYQQSSFLDASRAMFGDKTDDAIADELNQLAIQLKTPATRQALLQACVSAGKM